MSNTDNRSFDRLQCVVVFASRTRTAVRALSCRNVADVNVVKGNL